MRPYGNTLLIMLWIKRDDICSRHNMMTIRWCNSYIVWMYWTIWHYISCQIASIDITEYNIIVKSRIMLYESVVMHCNHAFCGISWKLHDKFAPKYVMRQNAQLWVRFFGKNYFLIKLRIVIGEFAECQLRSIVFWKRAKALATKLRFQNTIERNW
jgi:hypothetical protein